MANYQASVVGARPGGVAVQKVLALADVIRSDLWNRWLALAQRRALVWWRDRTVPPGLAARFTIAGVNFYQFGSRGRKPWSIAPYYHNNGYLQRTLLARKPKTKQMKLNGGRVETRLAYGGATLNLMDTTGKPNMRPVVGYTRVTRTLTESFNVASHTRANHKTGARVLVDAYNMTRQRTVTKRNQVRGGDTYAEAFGRFVKDKPAIEARVLIELRKIVRASAYDKKTGKIKSGVVKESELVDA